MNNSFFVLSGLYICSTIKNMEKGLLDDTSPQKEINWFLLIFSCCGIIVQLFQLAVITLVLFGLSEQREAFDNHFAWLIILYIVSLFCWIGILFGRKTAYYLYVVVFFTYCGFILFNAFSFPYDYYFWFGIVACIVLAGQLHKMNRFF